MMIWKWLYWTLTGLLVAWLALGGFLDLTQAQTMRDIMRRLHYPDYMLLILGTCKLLAVPALLSPVATWAREWAYAGITFNCLGAFVSHCAVRDAVLLTVAPLLMLSMAIGSYILRPHRDSGIEASLQVLEASRQK